MARAVFFDVGGTLMYANPPVPEVFARVARKRGHDIQTRDVEPCMAKVDDYYEAEYLRDGDFWCDHDRAVQIWLDMYAMMAEYSDIHDAGLPQAVYDEYLHARNWSFFTDADACVRQLKNLDLRLGIISNWDATLEGLIRRMGYLPYFDDVVASAAVGYRKPNPIIFEMALERMGIPASEAVHVGDLPEADGDGASAAGIRPIIIDRNGRYPDCSYERVSSLTELASIL